MSDLLKTSDVKRVIQNANALLASVNRLGFFRPSYPLQLELRATLPGPIELPLPEVERGEAIPSSLSVKYFLNEETFCTLMFEMEDREEGSVFTSFIPSVYSNLRYGTGTFLFYLQILLAHRSGARYIVLDNDTNNTERAAKGIYKWFRPNQRNLNEYNQERFKEASSLYHQLSVTGGKMVLDLREFSSETWKEHVKGISLGKPTDKDRPWQEGGIKEKIDVLVSAPITSYGPRKMRNRTQQKKTPYSRAGYRKTVRSKKYRQTRNKIKK